MTPEQKKLVKDSWAKVAPIKEAAADLFYNRLFENYPEVKPYFKGDMKEQGRKLMAMITAAVNGLDNLEELIEPIKDLGQRHVSYGVKKEDYEKVGNSLLWTLEQGLKDGFTPDVKEAWAVTYTAITDLMKQGAKYE